MNKMAIAVGLALLLCAAMLGLMELGRQLGRRKLKRDAEGARVGTGAVEGAVFALLGLVIAFTFSGAATRFDERKQLIIEEANCIGTAWLRLDVLPSPARDKVKGLFRAYLDARLEAYRMPDLQAVRAKNQRAQILQQEIWTECVTACTAAGSQHVAMLVLPALNAMFDIAATRMSVIVIHPPLIIFALLGFLALASSIFAGYGMAGANRRSWFHMLAFSVVIALSAYLIIDLEYPRLGVIRVDDADQLLIDLRKTLD
jgi:hypothetical protein